MGQPSGSLAGPADSRHEQPSCRRPGRADAGLRTVSVGGRGIRMIYGERVRQVREMHRLTQTTLADRVPTLTQPQLSRIEKDQATPDDETVAMLAAVLGV